MGATWTEAIGTLSGVWVNARSGVSQKESLHVDALITATIEGRKVMLCTQRGHASGEKRATALCLWVTDNKRTFLLGRLPWKMLRIERSPAPCCTRVASCIFYKRGATVRAVSSHFPA
ncbi:trans-sialidase [Trypanosoma cruzi]|nr:trans-sialidase [Trypanosoma cruzi]